MKKQITLLFLVLVTQAYSAPQFITFKDGKLGVNFGGYHAGVGLGGLAGGAGAGGGLFAEAGTPHGQAAKAGLGGVVDGNGASAGGLFAGATAGGNVNAAAGLGGIAAEKTAGGGFATAQAGPHQAASGLGGASSIEGSGGFTYSGSKSYQAPTVIREEIEVIPFENKPVHAHKKVHTEFNFDAANEVNPLPLSPVQAHADAKVDVSAAAAAAAVPVAPTIIIRDDSAPPQITRYHEKHIIHSHYKPHRHHLRKTAYIGGYVGGGADLPPPPPVQRRVDVGAEAGVGGGYGVGGGGYGVGGGGYGVGGGSGSGHITHEVTVNKNPAFFQDIFNIPISTLKAVGNFLSNTAGSTSVSVQKSASVHAEPNSSPKHDSSSSSSSSETHLSVETPSVSKIIDDIFAIPINTLGAVNKFLENNVPARKRILVESETGEPTKVRLGPHARRRANKRVVIVEEEKPETESSE